MSRLVGGNWKMNGSIGGTREYMEELSRLDYAGTGAEMVIFPTFTLLPAAAESAPRGVAVGGQDIFWEESGAFTGEVSAGMLRDAGATWFLAGHSERRHVIGEDDDTVRRKLAAGLSAGLSGILCIGELLSEREEGRTGEVLERQLRSALSGMDDGMAELLVVAYEPVWAIGTGRTATPEQAEEAHSFVRGVLGELLGDGRAAEARILYGGSVKPANASELLSRPSVDGALVGGASLRASDLVAIAGAG